jgi:hypothetical protein
MVALTNGSVEVQIDCLARDPEEAYVDGLGFFRNRQSVSPILPAMRQIRAGIAM